jgi:hypothetical protein
MRVVQCRGGASLAEKVASRIPGEPRPEHLDRYSTTEHGIASTINLSHPPGAERCQDLVMSESMASREHHA